MPDERFKPGQIVVFEQDGFPPLRRRIIADHGHSYDWAYADAEHPAVFNSAVCGDPGMEDWRVEDHSTAAT